MINSFAHNLGVKLTKDRVKSFYETLSPSDKEVAQETFRKSKEALSLGEMEYEFNKLSPSLQFKIIVTTLFTLLEVARKEIEGRAY